MRINDLDKYIMTVEEEKKFLERLGGRLNQIIKLKKKKKKKEKGKEMRVIFICHTCKEKIVHRINVNQHRAINAIGEIIFKGLDFTSEHAGHTTQVVEDGIIQDLWQIEKVEYEKERN